MRVGKPLARGRRLERRVTAAAREDLAEPARRRIGVVAAVRDDGEHSTGAENATDLRTGGVLVEPVERLRDGDGIDCFVAERDLLCRARDRLDAGWDERSHFRERLHRDDVRTRREERARELACPGAEVEHGATGREAEALYEIRDGCRRVAGSCALVEV